MHTQNSILLVVLHWVVGLRPIVRKWDLNLRGKWPPWGVFLREPSPHLCEFRKKLWKIPNVKVDRCDRVLYPAPPVYQF